MSSPSHSLAIIAVAAIVTLLLRALPFIAFQKKTPGIILYLGSVLPYAIMGMLVVYCLRSADPMGKTHAIPEIISVSVVAVLFKWKHNTLLSILAGTLCYMFLVQRIF